VRTNLTKLIWESYVWENHHERWRLIKLEKQNNILFFPHINFLRLISATIDWNINLLIVKSRLLYRKVSCYLSLRRISRDRRTNRDLRWLRRPKLCALLRHGQCKRLRHTSAENRLRGKSRLDPKNSGWRSRRGRGTFSHQSSRATRNRGNPSRISTPRNRPHVCEVTSPRLKFNLIKWEIYSHST